MQAHRETSAGSGSIKHYSKAECVIMYYFNMLIDKRIKIQLHKHTVCEISFIGSK